MNNLAPSTPGDLIERVVIKGDLSKLTPEQKSNYYFKVCESLGLNPLTKPFAYITLNGKEVLYALRDCTDQLRNVHGVSVEELSENERAGIFIVTAKVRNAKGRTDVATGAVSITNLRGELLANALMKAETKAKRRATLSICGLGFLDETEVGDIPGAETTPRVAPKPAPLKLAVPRDAHKPLADAQSRTKAQEEYEQALRRDLDRAPIEKQHDPEMGEVREIDEPHPSDPDASAAPEGFDFGAAEETTTERIKQLDDALAIAAAKGTAALKEAWDEIERDDKLLMRAALQRRHKKTAAEADKATTG
jgi:hypothetical protein